MPRIERKKFISLLITRTRKFACMTGRQTYVEEMNLHISRVSLRTLNVNVISMMFHSGLIRSNEPISNLILVLKQISSARYML